MDKEKKRALLERLRGGFIAVCQKCGERVIVKRLKENGVRFVRCPRCDQMWLTFEDVKNE